MSAGCLKVGLQDNVVVLTLTNPPANELTPDLRAQLIRAIAEQGAVSKGVVLTAEGPSFSNQSLPPPDEATSSIADLCKAVAECPVPVVALAQGAAVGAGAELLLAARARLVRPDFRVSFAEVALGLCPAAGTTFRLPRLIGAEAALRLLLSGRSVPAAEALSLGLIDGIVEDAAISSAVRLVRVLAAGEPILQRADPDPASWTKAVADARLEVAAKGPARRRIVDCVEAALILPPDQALAFEATARADLQQTTEAIGLSAAAQAERAALTVPSVLARIQPLSVDRIGLSGVRPDLVRIALAALSRGVSVSWSFPNGETLKAGLMAVRDGIADGLRNGQLAPDRARGMQDRLTALAGGHTALSVPVLICDATVAAQDRWTDLPGAARLVLGGQGEEMGLALAPEGRVCEVTLPADTLPLARATALAGLRRIGLAPVLAGQRPVIGARMADAGRTALAWMVAKGVPRRMILSALDGFGAPLPDPVSIEAPQIMRAMSATEALNRWLAALANEGARLLEEGIAKRPSDIDYLLVAGHRFPRWRGGPMHQAAQRGLMVLRQDLRAWGAEASLWSPAPLIDRLIREGRTLADLNR